MANFEARTAERFEASPRGGSRRILVVEIWFDGERLTSDEQPDDARAMKLCAKLARIFGVATGEKP